jgi:hypothetical protein
VATEPSNFEDPALKSAIRRAWADQRAPDALRSAVLLAAAASRPVPPKLPKLKMLGKKPLYKLAAAAMLAVGVASLSYQAYRVKHPYRSHVLVVEHLPANVVQMLTTDHDQLAAHPDVPSDLPRDAAQLTDALKSKLPYPPLTAPIGNGFSLVNATFGPVGSSQGSHLLYQRGPQKVSVYTLPASAAPSCSADAIINGGMPTHPVAGFTHGGAFYAVVGSSSNGSITAGDVQSIRDTLRGTVPGAACPGE